MRDPDWKPRILLGSFTRERRGAISIVSHAFIEGLTDRYTFIPFYFERRPGSLMQARLNVINIYHLLKHVLGWLFELVRRRPAIAHYPITSYWNFEKSLLMLTMSKTLGVRTVGHVHGGEFDSFWRGVGGMRKRIGRIAIRRLDKVIALSAGWKSFLTDEVGIKPASIAIVHNPIDAEFERAMLDLPVERSSSSILFLGALGKRKGVLDVIQAYGRLAPSIPWPMLVAGQAHEPGIREQCLEIARDERCADRVQFLGEVVGGQKVGLFRDAALFLFPSYSENFPLVILEAAAAGLPIVTTRVGAVPEFFVHGESVIFVTPGDVDEIARVIAELACHPETRTQLGKNARAVFVRHLSRQSVLDSLDRVYRELLEP